MAQGRSTEIITMIKWIRTSRLSIKELSLCLQGCLAHEKVPTPLGPYSRHMPRVLGVSQGWWRFLVSKLSL